MLTGCYSCGIIGVTKRENMNKDILDEAESIKRTYESGQNMESMWNLKEERLWRDMYYKFLKENNITDADVTKHMYPSSN